MTLTEDQIIQLAPDNASVKAGQQLANQAKWVSRYVHEQAMWGDCQGSGKNPYRTMVDLQQIAFKCSCPSRKFPCKHGLGLLFLYARQPGIFTSAETLEPQVAEWLHKRENQATAKAPKADKNGKPVDTKAQEKRAEGRDRKVAAGMEELRTWLKDLVRHGISHVPAEAYTFNKNIVARMVDAQAPAVAGNLRRLSDLNYYQDGWQKPFLHSISSLYLLSEAYQRLPSLDEALQADVRTLIGWNIPKEQVLLRDGVLDQWAVLAKIYETEERLSVEQVWLYGYQHQRFALLLNFYGPGQAPQHNLVPGTLLEAELVFYPSASPLRALIRQQGAASKAVPLPDAGPFTSLLTKVTQTLAVQPFATQHPFMGSTVRILYQNQSWQLTDAASNCLPLLNADTDGWRTLAITGGAPCTAFLLYEPAGVRLLAFWFDNQFYTLT
ncbi:SWIM zinc finger family protein [Pontibacter chinhatensis]|uniref:SWIM zinc finger n=1 Tax=Pontibacter chinhatensis TaxID=1436961 RepID=A0A1I2Z3C9_9BACT|nr:SWIM zinc finger family protein [Pontibacter chinhatensis]SFH32377.1 SWIM zinc finger [Pontibacter chinhatensis]